MKIKLDKGARIPTRAHSTDAGLDLYARETQIIPAKESAVFDTGVHVELPEGTAGFLKSKSGLNTKHGITSEGVIDVGYTGSIVAKLYNHSGIDYKVNAGDKITQLVIVPILTPELELVEALEEAGKAVDTVFSAALAEPIRPGESEPELIRILEENGIFYRPNGKTNVGLGKPFLPVEAAS